MTNRSSRELLIELPAVFTLSYFEMQAQMKNRQIARIYLSRMMQRGEIQSLGPRAGVYFNRVKEFNAPQLRLEEAVALVYPEATVSSHTVLHADEVTTQIPANLHVAVGKRRTYLALDGVCLHPRENGWFATLAQQGFLLTGTYSIPDRYPDCAPKLP